MNPLRKSQKDPEKRSLEKRVIEPLIYEYLLTYFNGLIQFTMEDEDLIWNDDEWFPDNDTV
jgi:hypothetical protein